MMGFGAAAAGPDLNQLLEEKRQEYRALAISELHFCQTACDLTKEQGDRIAKQVGGMVEEAAATAARLEIKVAHRGGIRVASDPPVPNPVKLVRDGLFKIVRECATPAQQGRYQAEITKRAKSRRETAIGWLVARLDRTLVLTGDQRDRLTRMFESNWDDEWGATLGLMADEDSSFPAIPDRLVLPILSATQQKIWNRLDKQAIVATDAYLSFVSEIMDGLPSEFAAHLEASARVPDKPPVAKPDAAAAKDNSNRGSR